MAAATTPTLRHFARGLISLTADTNARRHSHPGAIFITKPKRLHGKTRNKAVAITNGHRRRMAASSPAAANATPA